MKILFIGDYSSLHATLATQLKEQGHSVTLLSDGGKHMLTDHDIRLARIPGKVGGMKYLFQVMDLLPQLKGYDVVQMINPHFMSLRPGKLSYFFRQLKNQNGAMCLTLAGNDHHYVKTCLDGETFRYSEFRVGNERSPKSIADPVEEKGWTTKQMERYANLIYDNIDGAMSVLYEYDVAARQYLGERLAYIGLPIITRDFTFQPMEFADGKVNLFIGMVKGREIEKGTDILADIARQLECEMPDKIRTTVVSNLPLADYLKAMSTANIVLDQLYSYSPALNALDAMAMGIVAGSGAQPEIYDFIGENRLHPVLPLSPLDEDLKGTIRRYATDRDLLVELGRQSREYVEKHHEARLVADRYLQHCEKVMR